MKILAPSAIAVLFAAAAFAQPRINQIQNNYSYILPGMPNYGIAQGSIFDIFGVGLGTQTTPLQNVPLPLRLNGTSADITVNGVTTHAILYYVSATQIAAILPSATPTGVGQVIVTVNGKASPPAPITVVQSAFGMLSMNGLGNGPAAVYDINSNFLTLTNAANGGDYITLWGSGLGPVTGDETMTQTPVNLDIPLEIDIGGVPAEIQYQGRSVYPGLDQINVVVPEGVIGCQVSVVVRSGDIVSNFGYIPIAQSGRSCSEPDLGISAAQVQTFSSQASFTRANLDFDGSEADATFFRFTSAQFAVRRSIGAMRFGDCNVFNYANANMNVPNPAALRPVNLNAGASITLNTPSGSGLGNLSLPFQNGAYVVSNLTSTGSQKGTFTFTGTGGSDIGPFSAQVTWPGGGSGFKYSAPVSGSVLRSQGLTLTWTQPNNSTTGEFVQIGGYAFVPNMPWGAEFTCNVALGAGRFTIPAAVLLALPQQQGVATPQATLEVDLIVQKTFSTPDVDLGFTRFIVLQVQPFSYQ